MKIIIDHIAKIEGHMGFVGQILRGNIAQAKLDVQQSARLIEGILIGRRFAEAPLITARICGVCPVVHNLCAIKALENALEIEPSTEIVLLRKILLAAQIIQSHSLHLFFLTLPDYLNLENDLNLTKKYPQETRAALKVKSFSDKLVKIIGGRAIHPTATQIGGFGRYPSKKELKTLLNKIKTSLKSALRVAQIFSSLNYPLFERKTEYISLGLEKEYAFYSGQINTTGQELIPVDEFLPEVQEIETPSDVVKRAKYKGKSFMVGAIARINNNFESLNPRARKVLVQFSSPPSFYNPFYNIFAQAVEVVHFIEEIGKLLEKALAINFSKLSLIQPKPKPSWGVAACEAPRGTLFHIYELDKKGIIRNCNIITPTAQFLENLEEDLKIYLPSLKGLKPETQRKKIRMLIRAYDPCISCAVH